MEGEAFDPSPQTSMEREGKGSEDVPTQSEGASSSKNSGDVATGQPASGTWREAVQAKVQPVVQSIGQGTAAAQSTFVNHPYVQSIGQGTATAQSTFMNHPYVQRSSELLSKGAQQVRSSAGPLQPVVGRAADTVQLGKDTARKIYNKEEGYEAAKVAPYFAGGAAVLLLCILLGAWSVSDGRSKYKVDVTKIVAEKVQIPNGRHFAYVEQGASKEEAKHNVLFVHGLLSSRLLGLSGVNENLLKKYGVRLVAYDRPGIGQSDPQLKRNLNTSSEDMADLADALGMGDKFWVFAHSEGAAYAWAALHYIPSRLSGVALFGPVMNPYAKNTTKEESKAMWAGLGPMKSTFRYARYWPSFVPGKLKGSVNKVNKYMKSTKKRVNSKDRALLETSAFGEAWERAIRESVRSGDPEPHAQDLILQAHNWDFKLSDIRATPARRSIFKRIFLFWRSVLPGFSGPIHIFHGTEDNIAPVVMSEYAKRLLPQVELHKLEGEGHYSWFFNCDSCHRELFKTLFGEVEGLEELDNPVVLDHSDASKEPGKVEEPVKSGPTDAEREVEKVAPVDAQAEPQDEL